MGRLADARRRQNWTDLSDKFKAAGLPGRATGGDDRASRSVAGRCYVAFDAHRSDDDEALPLRHRGLRPDLEVAARQPAGAGRRACCAGMFNPDLLYLGTEFAAWASINRGASWFKINGPPADGGGA